MTQRLISLKEAMRYLTKPHFKRALMYLKGKATPVTKGNYVTVDGGVLIKELIDYATYLATGRHVDRSTFSGGKEANSVAEKFRIRWTTLKQHA